MSAKAKMVFVDDEGRQSKLYDMDWTRSIPLNGRIHGQVCDIENIGEFINGYATVCKDSRFGFIDEHLNEVGEIKYDWVEPFDYGVARVRNDGNWSLINEDGEELIPFDYRIMWDFFSFTPGGEGYAIVCKFFNWGIINTRGEEVTPVIYDGILMFDIDRSMDYLCVYGYQAKKPFKGSIVVAQKGDTFKIIDEYGRPGEKLSAKNIDELKYELWKMYVSGKRS